MIGFSLYLDHETEATLISSARSIGHAIEEVFAHRDNDLALRRRMDSARVVVIETDHDQHVIKDHRTPEERSRPQARLERRARTTRFDKIAAERPVYTPGPRQAIPVLPETRPHYMPRINLVGSPHIPIGAAEAILAAMTRKPAADVILDKWNACAVRRWHTNPHLRDTLDPIDGHSARVLIIALDLYPPLSREAMIYALTHDGGEHAVGDVSYEAKRKNPAFADMARSLEEEARIGLGFPAVTRIDDRSKRVIKLADWLDSWLWMIRHKPGLRLRADWVKQAKEAHDLADALGGDIPGKLKALVARVEADLEKGIPA